LTISDAPPLCSLRFTAHFAHSPKLKHVPLWQPFWTFNHPFFISPHWRLVKPALFASKVFTFLFLVAHVVPFPPISAFFQLAMALGLRWNPPPIILPTSYSLVLRRSNNFGSVRGMFISFLHSYGKYFYFGMKTVKPCCVCYPIGSYLFAVLFSAGPWIPFRF